MKTTIRGAALAVPVLLLCATAASAADLEGPLNGRWKGGWVLVRTPISSDCNGFATDNNVQGGRVDSRGSHDFAAGELAQVDRVSVKWGGRVDVFLDLAEQILDSHTDGPFTLYDPRSCKVQLKFEGAGKKDLASAEAVLASLLELHPDARQAESSPAWNRRRREDYPPDYERTLAEYETWKASQTNVAVQTRMNEAIEEAARTNDRIREDPEYLAGFAAGVERARDHSFGDCGSLIEASFFPDTARGKSEPYRDGYSDGQRLAFDLELLRRLRGCFVPVPPPAG